MDYAASESSMDHHVSMDGAVGQSEAFIQFQEQISRVAPIDRPVIILGERGTGKELAATRIHFLSGRWQKPLVTLNCSALAPTLIESELFGYEKGAFTGAGTRHTGRFEQAADGTLFLDEIGTIPMEVQEKILRVVEYGAFERVGSSRPIRVDVRIVAATNADLAAMTRAGTFKRDLVDRLSFEVIYVPPLRYRKEDILLLANHFASRMAFELGWDQVPELTTHARKILSAYPWPGNIRELKNVIERAVYKSTTPRIHDIVFDPFENPYKDIPHANQKKSFVQSSAKLSSAPLQTASGAGTAVTLLTDAAPEGSPSKGHDRQLTAKLMTMPLKEAVQALETLRVEQALAQSRFHHKKAAEMLGLSYDQFRGMKKRLGI
ncbi:MAG: phage shock protein operon transcriptional activator [Desulfotignum sp.]|nr:phage shock protein operon transcriptional activator [Desulfobacteraceae bacterium]